MVKEKAKKRIFNAINLALILMVAAFLIGNWSNITNSNSIVSQNFATGMAVSAPSVTGQVTAAEACPDVVAYWTFDDAATTQTDVVGESKGILTNNGVELASTDMTGMFVNGVSGKALKLSNYKYFLFSDTLNSGKEDKFNWPENNSFTYSIWVNLLASQKNGTIISQRSTTDEDAVIDIMVGFDGVGSLGDGKVGAVVRDNDGNLYRISSTKAINDAQWHQIVLTKDASAKTFNLYIDGDLAKSISYEGQIFGAVTTNYYRTIGLENQWFDKSTDNSWKAIDKRINNGMVDEFIVYSKALNATEVSNQYSALSNAINKGISAKYCQYSASVTSAATSCTAKGGEPFNYAGGEKCINILDSSVDSDHDGTLLITIVPAPNTDIPTVAYKCCDKIRGKVYVPYDPATETCPTENKLGALCEKGAKSGKTGCENLGGKPYFVALQTCSSTDTSNGAVAGLKAGYGCCKVEPVNKTCAELGGSIVIDSTKSKCNGGSINVVYPIMGLSSTELCCKSVAELKTLTGTCAQLGYTQCNKTSTTKTVTSTVANIINLYLKFDEDSGDALVDNITGTNAGSIIGTVTRGEGAKAESGKSISFSGLSSNNIGSISINDNEKLSPQSSGGKMTLEAWIRIDSAIENANHTYLLKKDGEYSLSLKNNGELFFEITGQNNYSNNALYASVSGGNLSSRLGTWHHIAVVFDQSAPYLRLYIDGAKVSEKTSGFPNYVLVDKTLPLTLNGDSSFSWGIDELAIWPVAIDQQLISSHYSTGVYPTSVLMNATQTVKGESCYDNAWVGATDDDTSINSGMHCCSTGCVQDPIPKNCEGVSMGTQGILNQKCSGKIIVAHASEYNRNYFCCLGKVSSRTTSTLNCSQQGGEQFDNTAQFCYGGSIISAKDSSGTVQCCSGVAKLNSEKFIFGATEGTALTIQGTGGGQLAGGLCIYKSKSYSLGQIADGKYCDTDGQMKTLKEKDAACTKHYECKSNSCYSGQCTDVRTTLSLIPRIWCWLKSWIANPTDVETREIMVCECLAEYGNPHTLEPEVC